MLLAQFIVYDSTPAAENSVNPNVDRWRHAQPFELETLKTLLKQQSKSLLSLEVKDHDSCWWPR